jgi:hypothetical protein
MDSQESSGGGSATLYIIVFLLCVISAVVGYFQFTLGSQRAEAERKMKEIQTESERKMKEIQAKAEADMTAAKSEEEKREIQRKAQIESERVKMKAQADSERATMKAQTDAEKKALANREAKIKAAEAAVNKRLADAAARVRNAQNLQNQAKKVKTDADNKKRAADAAMAKALKTGKDNDKKLAAEKKRIAADAARKVSAANKKAAQAAAQARAEANKALTLKKKYDKLSGDMNLLRVTVALNNALPGWPRNGVSGRVLDKGPTTSNPRVCRDWAAREGFAMWGHRNDKFPNKAYKNTCFAYERVTSKYRGDGNDNIHMVGCTFTDLRPDQIVCPSGSAKAVAVRAVKGVPVPQASPALQNEARALVRKFPTIRERIDHPGHDIAHHGFSGNIPREAIIKHCLSDCVNRGCDCAAVTFSSDFKNCWLKNENAIKNQKPIPDNNRATLIKPSRTVRKSGRKVTRYC